MVNNEIYTDIKNERKSIMKSKRILSVLLAIVMLSTVLPTVVFANSTSGTATGGLITGTSDFDTVLGAGNYEYSDRTIKILKDLTFYNPLMFELTNTYFTLDLNGKTLDMQDASVILYKGGLTIIDSGNGGTIKSGGDTVRAISYESDLNISGGTFTATGYGVAVTLDNCRAAISGGTFTGRYAIQRLNGVSEMVPFKLSGSPVLNGYHADIYIENPSSHSSVSYYGYEPADGDGPASIMVGNWPDVQYGRVVTNWDNDKTLSDYFVYAGTGSQNDPFIVEDPLYENFVVAEKPYDVWIGTTRVTRLNQDDVFGDGTVSFTPTSTYVWELNLNNFSYEGSAHSSDRGIIDIENYPYENHSGYYHLSANVTGTNTIVAKNTPAYGIVTDSNFSLNGDGSLKISGCKYGMYITDANNWQLTKAANSIIPTLEITSTVATSNKSMYLYPNDKEYKLTLGTQAPVRNAGGKNIAIENVTYLKVEEAPIKPVISIATQPAASTKLTEGKISGALTVAGSVANGSSASLNYQWYSSNTGVNFNGTLIEGATGSSFTIPENLAPGTYYYYCTLSMEDANTVRSNVATVVVEAEVIVPTHTHRCGHDECDGAWENFVVIDGNIGASTNPRLTGGNTYYFVLGNNMRSIGFNPSIGSGTATVYLCLNGQSINDITIPVGVTMYVCDCADEPGIVSARFNVYGTAMLGSGRYPLLRQMGNDADVHVYGPITMGDYADFSSAGNKTIKLDNEDAKIHFSSKPYCVIKFAPYAPGVFATGWESSFKYMPISADDAYEIVYDSAKGELSFVEKAAPPVSYNITKAATENGSLNVPATAIEDEEVTIVATPDDGYELENITVTGESGNVTVTDGKFTMPGEDVTVNVTFKKKILPHTHCVCGAIHKNIGNHSEENHTWTPIISADDFTKDKYSGYYYLTDDIEVSSKWEFTKSRDIVLCLNGYDIIYTGSSNVSFIPGSTDLNFTLTDCKAEAGSISGFKNIYGGAINVKKTFTMYNGKITGNTATQGGGVYVDQPDGKNATFYMYGGEITGNTASSLGGGVFIKGAMEVAGAPVVNGNENSNTADTSYQNKMSSFTKNIYSSNDAVVVGAGGLTAGAQLDITPKFPVSSGESPAAVTTIATGCTSDLSAYFTYTSGFNYTKQYDATEGKVQLVYAPVKYTVTFNMQGHGTQVEEQSVETGTYATEPSPAPTAQGYTFGGWYTTPECGYWDDFIFDFSKITDDKTLYAKWTLNAPTISGAEGYTADYDGASHEISVTANSASNLSYSYQWYKGGKAEENEMDGATSATYSVKNVVDSGTYYCKVTVSDGSSINSSWSDAVTVAIAKASVAVPTVSSKFYTGENLVADISDTVDYIVTTNEGGIAVDEYDVVLTLKDSANYKWADGTETAEKTIIFCIVQSGTEFTDVKVLNGGSESTAFTYGDTITVKVKPEATGNAVPSLMMLMSVSDPTENQMALYLGDTQVSDAASADGEGYYTMTVDTTEGVLPIGGSITLSAKYVGNTNMADYSMPVTLTLSKANQSAPETPAVVGETIKGKNDGKITGVTDAMEYKKQGDADYIAITGTEIADLAAETYLVRYKETDGYLASPDNQLVVADGALITVTFASNGGSAVDSQTCEYNQTITAPDAPTKEGFEFIAWYADDALTTKWDFANTFTETQTLYAKWVQGTVSDHEDHVDELEAEGLNDIAKAEETDIKLVVRTEPIAEGDTEQTAIKDITDAPDNFIFYDITLEKSTGGYVTDASSVIEIKLPYDFSRKTNIKVYRCHNGIPEELAQLEAKATAPYVDGKCFIDAANNCFYIYSSKFSTYAVAYDTVRSSSGGGVTRYTVKFDTDGGSEIASKTVTRNSKIAEPTVPKKEGYKFDGWFADEEFTTAYDFDSKITKNITLYAKWEKVNDEKEENPDTHNCPSKSFDDLDVTLWYHLDVDYVLENGLMKGIDTKTFAPNGNLTRAMLVTVLYRMENEPSTNRSIPFSDVDMGAYYANAVSWAKQNGIVNGVTETEFAPNDNITREQIAAIMYRYAQYKGMDAVTLEENLHFADTDEISEYAVSSMNWAVGTGLINGKSESILAPKDNATRAEVAAILQRFMEAN